MPQFFYKIRDRHGRLSEGLIESESEEAVASHFKKMGYAPTLIKEKGISSQGIKCIEKFFNRVSVDEIIIFTQQLMTLQRAGVSILTSLQAIREQLTHRYFKNVIDEICKSIESGKNISEAMAQFPKIFSDMYVNMVRAGETAGILDNVLERLANLYEHERDLNMRVKQAMRYPLLVLIALSIAFPLAVLFIIPKFASLFARFNTNLPLPTKMLLGLHFMLVRYWFFVIIGVAALVMIARKLISTPKGKYIWDSLTLKMPIFGELSLKVSMSRFTRMTALLSASGIPIINIMEIIRGFIGNSVIAGNIDNIIKGITEGKGIAEPMKVSTLFPPVVIQMVKIGEETGKLDELLLKVSDYYDTQVGYTVKNLTVLIEPILILILGIMVLILALAIFLPMWNLISVFR